ncbi:MAG: hypothetical protein ACMG51_10630 [Ginsengibacter sp.]
MNKMHNRNLNRKSIVNIFKILSVSSFLLVMIPNQFIAAPIFLWMIALILGTGAILQIVLAVIVLTLAFFVIYKARTMNRKNDWISLTAILLFDCVIANTIKDVFAQPYFIFWFSYLVYFLISTVTLVILIRNLVVNNYY